LTVIGGQSSSNGGLTGLVTIPSGFTGTAANSIQSLLVAATALVTTGAASFQNLDIAGQTGLQTVTPGGGTKGLLLLSNQNSSTNASTSGSANVVVNVPSGYNNVVVQAPGSETINGNGGTGQVAIFGANSTVNFMTGGGSGTVYDGAPGNMVLSGNGWSLTGSPNGAETVAALASNSVVSVSGPQSNIISTNAQNVSVISGGTNDLDVVYSGTAFVSMAGGGNTLLDGGAATVTATNASSAAKVFFDANGGQLDFINNSTTPASVLGAVAGAVGGNATVFGGVGGGYFQGGPGGNNSLVGGSGSVTLIGSGDSNYLAASGANNAFFATGGATTMVGAAGSRANLFNGGTGSLVVSTSGSGTQDFFVGAQGQEVFTGSTVSGASNNYYFVQGSTGSGSDIIQNFRVGQDHIFINPFDGTSNVAISAIASIPSAGSHPQGGSLILLSDNTSITLYGVSAGEISNDVGRKTV
jgi:hypothetical protein